MIELSSVMVKIWLILILGLVVNLFALKPAYALVDPISSQNNKFGIHVIDENDLKDAANLVNSSGGEWGYVTLVIKEEDRDLNKWQNTFDKMRELKLIPLVRLATKPQGSNWEKPTISDAREWADFLSNLNWVVKNRYVIIFNEPNHAKEWGGEINPREYSEILKAFNRELKLKSQDFYILPAGFDASAPNSRETLDITHFLEQMYLQDSNIFLYIDGWNSHSYPNPGFSSSPQRRGKGSIASFDWELNYLRNFGGRSSMPVFITETGWVHNNGKTQVLGINSETVGDFYKQAFESVWSDNRVVAVTPFVLNYQDSPFDYFSWKKIGGQEFHPQYGKVQGISKTAGQPEQEKSVTFVSDNLPPAFFSGFEYNVDIVVKNTGQSIWSYQEGYRIVIPDDLKPFISVVSDIQTLKPFQEQKVRLKFKPFYGQNKVNFRFQVGYKNEILNQGFLKEVKIIDLLPISPKQKIETACLRVVPSCT